MITEKNDPAFAPAHDPRNHAFGLTKKEYLTACAMQGLLSQGFGSQAIKSIDQGNGSVKVDINTSQVAIAAVKIAEKTIQILNISEEVNNEQKNNQF